MKSNRKKTKLKLYEKEELVEYLTKEKPHSQIETSVKCCINYIKYNESSFYEEEITDLTNLREKLTTNYINWFDLVGFITAEILQKFAEQFNIHPLILEDIQSSDQRSKVEIFPEYIFIVLKSVNYIKAQEIHLEQISMILGDGFLVSFQEYPPNQFENLYERLRKSRGRIRKMSSDYLAYSLLDILVDNYFIILEDYGDRLDEVEDNVANNPTPELLQTIYNLKKDIILIRKSVWPLREIISKLGKMGSELINSTTELYLRDIYDHVIQIIDTVETYRDILSSMIDIFMSSVSNKMNEIMKVLTIIATIFIPLTFVAGIYGMNFPYMPEFTWKWSYFIVLILMVVLSFWMLYFFKRRRWL